MNSVDQVTLWHNRHRAITKLGRFTLWYNGRLATTQLGRFTLCGPTAAKLRNSVDLLCGTTTAELHNSADLLCGTTTAELNNPVSLMHAPGVAHIFQRQWAIAFNIRTPNLQG